MSGIMGSVGVRATALDGGIYPALRFVAWLGAGEATRILHAINHGTKVFGSASAIALRLCAVAAAALADFGACRKSVGGRKTCAPCRRASTVLTTHGRTRMSTGAAVEAVDCEVRARPIARGASIAKKHNFGILDGFVSSLIKESSTKHERERGILKIDRSGLLDLHPRQGERVCTSLSGGNKRPVVDHLILAQEATTDNVIHSIRIGQEGRESDRLTLRDFADVCVEAEEQGPALDSGRTAGRSHACHVNGRRFGRGHPFGRSHPLARWAAGHGACGSLGFCCRLDIASAGCDQNHDARQRVSARHEFMMPRQRPGRN